MVARCVHLIALLDQDEDAVRAGFTSFCERQYQSLRTPHRPHETWPPLGDAIFDGG